MSFIINSTKILQTIEFPDANTNITINPESRIYIRPMETGLPMFNSKKYIMLSQSCYFIIDKNIKINKNIISIINTTQNKLVIDLYYKNILMYGVIISSKEVINNQGQYATKVGFRDSIMNETCNIKNYGRIIIIKQKAIRNSVIINKIKVFPSDFMPVWILMNSSGFIKVVTHNKSEICKIKSHNSDQRYTILQTTFNIAYLLMKQQNYNNPRATLYDKALVIRMH